MKHKQIFWNAATTMIQVVGSACTLFVLYRFLIRTIGVERLGIWSLVLATTSVVTLANQGFSTSIVKFVAKYAALGDRDKVAALVETAIITVSVLLTVLCAALYPLAQWGLKIILPAARVPEAVALLPYAFTSLWINILGSILLAGLAGHELVTHRNYIVLGGSLLYLLLTLAWVPKYGLLGLAYAQTTNTLACFLASWYLLRRTLPHLATIPHRLDRKLFREMWGYGAHFQFVTFSQALREPVTKALLAKFGGLAMTGFYDMASRWVFTFRELIVQANLVLVPTVSSLRERDSAAIPRIYLESYRVIFFLAVPAFTFLAVVSPIVSHIWLGRYEPAFVRFVALLAAGWLVNVLSNPAYVVDLGTGALRWVSIGCAATAVLNPLLGYLAGRYSGATAIVAVAALSLSLGYLIILVAYHVENRVSFLQLIPSHSAGLVCASALGVIGFLPYFCSDFGHAMSSAKTISVMALAVLTMILPIWRHPLRKRLMGWVASSLPA